MNRTLPVHHRGNTRALPHKDVALPLSDADSRRYGTAVEIIRSQRLWIFSHGARSRRRPPWIFQPYRRGGGRPQRKWTHEKRASGSSRLTPTRCHHHRSIWKNSAARGANQQPFQRPQPSDKRHLSHNDSENCLSQFWSGRETFVRLFFQECSSNVLKGL